MKQYRLHNLTLLHKTCRYPSYLAYESLQVGPAHVSLHVARLLALHVQAQHDGLVDAALELVRILPQPQHAAVRILTNHNLVLLSWYWYVYVQEVLSHFI